MYGYAGASQTASTFTPFMPPLPSTNPAGLGAQGAAVAQAACTPAGTAAQTVAPLTTAMSTPVSAALPNAGLASTASSMSSTSSMSQMSLLTTLTSSSTALTSGMGSGASMSTSGISMLGPAGGLMRSVGPAAGIFGNQFQAWGSTLGSGFGSGTGAVGTPGIGSAAVTAGVGRAASVGMLSVPQSWASAAPAFSQVAPALPGTSGLGATPAVGTGGPGGSLGGMPMLANAMRGTGSSTPPRLTIGYRPAMVPDPLYAG
jgi:PPE-repeat protein